MIQMAAFLAARKLLAILLWAPVKIRDAVRWTRRRPRGR